jgi:hypothetical protein
MMMEWKDTKASSTIEAWREFFSAVKEERDALDTRLQVL